MVAKKVNKFNLNRVILIGVSILMGAALVLAVRFATYSPPERVHYHANFAIYINGQRQKLDNPLLYESGSMCAEGETHNPSERAHMHDMVNDVVHVEDEAVTWGHFFQNIGYGTGDEFISTSSAVHMADTNNRVTFMLNGEKVADVTRKVIEDKDRLLVDFGNTTKQDLQKEFDNISDTAAKYDSSPDPASCGAGHQNSMKERFKHMF